MGRLRGPESPWYGYLQCLPEELVNIAVFWGMNGNQDGIQARAWIQGTEVEKLLVGSDGCSILVRNTRHPHLNVVEPLLQDRVNAYFEQTAKPILLSQSPSVSLGDFHRAYSLVSSRAFLVDAYHGLSLVPVADA